MPDPKPQVKAKIVYSSGNIEVSPKSPNLEVEKKKE
jgi:hypothetical protein